MNFLLLFFYKKISSKLIINLLHHLKELTLNLKKNTKITEIKLSKLKLWQFKDSN